MKKLILLFLSLTFIFSKVSFGHELVLDHDFPDPTIIRAADGWYYAYATQAMTEEATPRLLNLQVARSRDLKSWQHLGDALPVKPTWAKTTQNFWAPHIHYAYNLYYLYYSAEPDTKDGLCLAVAVSRNPQGPFVDSGKPMVCGPGFSNIDPMVFNDPQSKMPLLYWGSGFESIRVQPLTQNLLSLNPRFKKIDLVWPDRSSNPAPYTKLLEGAWVIFHQGYFYLFVSGENCCSPPDPQYAVLVLRSRNSNGPFEWKDNDPRKSVVIQSSDRFKATGHNAFIHDANGQLWSFHHGVDTQRNLLRNPIAGDRLNRRVLLRSKINFVNGWPVSQN